MKLNILMNSAIYLMYILVINVLEINVTIIQFKLDYYKINLNL